MGITGPWSRPGEPTGEEAPARGGVGTLPSPSGGVGTLSSSPTTLLGGGVLDASSSLVGVLAVALAGAGCASALVAAVAAAGCSVACGAASPTAATGSAVLCSETWSGLTSDAALNNKTTFKQCQKQQQKTERRSAKVKHLQVRSSVHCGEPPPGPTGWHLRSCLCDTRCRRVAGHPISGGRRSVRTTTRPPNQRRCSLLLLVVVGGDPDEPTAFRRLAALCWQRWHRGRVCC